MSDKQIEGLKKLREPFFDNQISKLPKPTKKQTDDVKANYKAGIRCGICGGWHHPQVIHLDYVGHAALTDRLLEVDPLWNWEPMAIDDKGLPLLDANGGMWIKLTIFGMTRLGYGDSGTKKGCDAMKEKIGDCLARGTIIATSLGAVPIEKIKIGDFVKTRSGLKPVTDHWLSRPSAPVVKVTLSDGKTITGTPHHKIPTYTGDKRLRELRNGDMIYVNKNQEDICHLIEKKRRQKILSGVVGYIGETGETRTNTGLNILCPQLHQDHICIETSGNITTKREYLKVGMSITKMAILRITKPITSWLYHRVNTLKNTGKATAQLKNCVLTVEDFFMQFLTAQSGALLPARSLSVGIMGFHILDQKKSNGQSKDIVRNAVKNIPQKDIGASFALVGVEEVTEDGIAEVWNISVGETHEYIANGIVVYNSLRNAGMRFGMALDLWHKGDLHVDDEELTSEIVRTDQKQVAKTSSDWESTFDNAGMETVAQIASWRSKNGKEIVATLSKAEQIKFKNYLNQCQDALILPEIECKATGLLSSPEQCRKSECSSTYEKCAEVKK